MIWKGLTGLYLGLPLITEILDLSRIEANKLDLKNEIFNLNQLVISTLEDIQLIHPSHRINIFHEFRCTVYGDITKLEQVIINLLINAIKFSLKNEAIDVYIQAGNKIKLK